MSRRVVTKEDVIAAAKSGVLEVGPDDYVTEAALEASTRENVRIVRASPHPNPPPAARGEGERARGEGVRAATPAFDHFAPGTAALSATDGSPAAIVTAVGKNRAFVLAEITTKIGELNGDIYDISQRIISGYFSTILVVDIGRVSTDFAGFKQALEALSREGDYKIVVQHERVFRAMHRI
ncbi:MAG TPA: ACT domain-containing protein [Planctomycetota bacterium]|nr:ACT domain-containing protein [Planctomycetota bacterium]